MTLGSRLLTTLTCNGTPDGCFFEIGREQDDGSITGTVWRHLNAKEKAHWQSLDRLDERVTRRGSFKIDAKGHVVRFPGISKDIRKLAEEHGAKRYEELYAPLGGKGDL